MSRATTITFGNFLLNDLGSATQLGDYYDEVVLELGKGTFEDVISLTDAELVAVTAGTGTYNMPTTAIRTLSLTYDNQALSQTNEGDAAVYDPQWRALRGRPFAFSQSDENERAFTLVPTPGVTGQTIGLSTVFSFTAWPSENLMFIFTETRTDVHLDEELWLALEIASRELARDSNHHDQQAAGTAKKLAELFRALSYARE